MTKKEALQQTMSLMQYLFMKEGIGPPGEWSSAYHGMHSVFDFICDYCPDSSVPEPKHHLEIMVKDGVL